jgi:hypothetical protein
MLLFQGSCVCDGASLFMHLVNASITLIVTTWLAPSAKCMTLPYGARPQKSWLAQNLRVRVAPLTLDYVPKLRYTPLSCQ